MASSSGDDVTVGKESTEEPEQSSSGITIPDLTALLGRSLGIRENPEQLLPTVNVDGVIEYILSQKCRNIVTMAGAGISTSAGIPDFRSPNSGLYANLQKYHLPDPMAIFSLDFFKENPKPFFSLAKELWPGYFQPTPCHFFIKLLLDKGLLLRHYTQNIDTLERVAGIDPDKIVEAHGTFHSSHCVECHKEYSQDWIKEQIFRDVIPTCEDCNSVVKPDIVFFGEALPDRFATLVNQDLKDCDLLIVLGTSLTVQPFASLTARVPIICPRLYINREKTGSGGDPFMALLLGGGGFEFDSDKNYRDVFLQGDCDDGCISLSEKLGWKSDLDNLIAEFKKNSPATSSSSSMPVATNVKSNISTSSKTNIGSPNKSTKNGTESKTSNGTPSKSKNGTPSKSKNGTPSKSKNGTPSKSKNDTPSTTNTGIPSKLNKGTPSTTETGTPSKTNKDTPSKSDSASKTQPLTNVTSSPNMGSKTGSPTKSASQSNPDNSMSNEA